MKRDGSRFAYFVQRIPADIRGKVAGERLASPLGDGVKHLTIGPRAQAVRFSLLTVDPSEVKMVTPRGGQWYPSSVANLLRRI
jgi:hypothetical protein